MAKTSMVEREKRRAGIVKKYAVKRAQLKEIIRSPRSSPEQKLQRRRSCSSSRAMRARRAGASAARSRAVPVACTASSVSRA